jgi:hypothetical protein
MSAEGSRLDVGNGAGERLSHPLIPVDGSLVDFDLNTQGGWGGVYLAGAGGFGFSVLAVSEYTSPERVRIEVKGVWYKCPESFTLHGPDEHSGTKIQDSDQLSPGFRPQAGFGGDSDSMLIVAKPLQATKGLPGESPATVSSAGRCYLVQYTAVSS